VTIDGPGFNKKWAGLVGTYAVFRDVFRVPFASRWLVLKHTIPPVGGRFRLVLIDLSRDLNGVIVPEIRRLQEAWRKDVERRTGKPAKAKERHEALGKFLVAYDAYQARDGRKWRAEAIRSIFNMGPDHGLYDNRQRLVTKYLQCARRIIENVERGEFPGKY
jgi:hypothetical protein